MHVFSFLQRLLVWAFSFSILSAPIMPSDTAVSARRWVDIWTTANYPNDPHLVFPKHKSFPQSPPRMFVNSTIRQTFRTSLATDFVRVRVSNEYSPTELRLSGASIALPTLHRDHLAGSPSIEPNSSIKLTFSGYESVDIPKWATLLSDPIPFQIPAQADVTVSLYLAEGQEGELMPGHEGTKAMSWMAEGNHLASPTLEGTSAVEFKRWYYVSSIEGHLPAKQRAVACFGDSITDQGQGELPINEYHGWPDRLAQRLQAEPTLKDIGVVNVGISGDMVYGGGLARFDRDVIARPGVEYVVILMGVNDLNHHENTTEGQAQAYDRITMAFAQMIDRAHEAGIPIFGCTILPYLAPPNYSLPPPLSGTRPSNEPIREGNRMKINHWIRNEAKFDAVFDFDAAMKDPEHPWRMQTKYGGLDYVHPSAEGLINMGNTVDLKAFEMFRK